MKSSQELVYLGRRAAEERSAARGSHNRVVREVHLELATAYEFRIHLLKELAAKQPAETPQANAEARPALFTEPAAGADPQMQPMQLLPLQTCTS